MCSTRCSSFFSPEQGGKWCCYRRLCRCLPVSACDHCGNSQNATPVNRKIPKRKPCDPIYEDSPKLQNKFYFQTLYKGLGQLDAYTEEEEGVALQMDNGMFWDSVGGDNQFPIQAVDDKAYSSKFFVTVMPSGKVALRDCRGLYLAPKPLGKSQPIYPLYPLHQRPQASSEFKVFHRGNRVAFQAHDGCFLAKVFRGVYTVEASKTMVDSSCFFRPQIGDLLIPGFDIVDVAVGDLSNVRCSLCVLKKETYINRSDEPENHTFTLTWSEEVTHTTVWTHLWGLGLPISTEFRVLDATATLNYNEDNDKVVTVPKTISETRTEVVELPPKSRATARLVVYKRDNAAVSFKARIRKLRSDGSLQGFVEPGAWSGPVYYGLKLEVNVEPLGILCPTM